MSEVARDERADLGLSPFEALDPYALAAEHGIRIYPLDALVDQWCGEDSLRQFTQNPRTWSAALIPVGSARIIIENPAHSPARRRSSIGHELGHHLLEHPFDGVLLTADGCRNRNKAQE